MNEVEVSKVPTPGKVKVFVEKEYQYCFPMGIAVKIKRNDNIKDGKLRFSIPEKSRNGFYYMAVGEPQIKKTALIKVPVSVIPAGENPIKWLIAQKVFKAIKFVLYTHGNTYEFETDFNDINIDLSQVLVEKERNMLNAIKEDVESRIKYLNGFRSIQNDIVHGMFSILVEPENAIPFKLTVKYAMNIAGLLDADTYSELEKLSVVREPDFNTFTNENLEKARLILLKALGLI